MHVVIVLIDAAGANVASRPYMGSFLGQLNTHTHTNKGQVWTWAEILIAGRDDSAASANWDV